MHGHFGTLTVNLFLPGEMASQQKNALIFMRLFLPNHACNRTVPETKHKKPARQLVAGRVLPATSFNYTFQETSASFLHK